jgi:hypothetical protein
LGEIYPEDVRDPSAFFATFETGDNTVVTEETATVPLDMYYSRASNFGDDWDEQDICATDPEESWYPNASVVCDEGVVELRWDWLENGDDLATEASVFGNPNGDRFYAVWNQELPIGVDDHGETISTDMDSEFRRIFYNLFTEVAPTASIVYASDTILSVADGDVLTLVGFGRDFDRQGEGPQIQGYDWFDDKGAIHCKIDDYDDDGNPVYECEKEIEIKAGNIEQGHRTVHLRVKDNEGHWSKSDQIEIWVVEDLHQLYLPITTK